MEIDYNFKFNDETDEIIKIIERENSYYLNCKIKELYEHIYSDISDGNIYYVAKRNCYETKFDITLSDGQKIGEITLDGYHDNVPNELHENIVESYKAQSEKILLLLNNKIHLMEQEKKKKDAIMICVAVATFSITVILVVINKIFFS